MRKKKDLTEKQARKMGYTSFSSDDFTNQTNNVASTELFRQMMLVPKKVQKCVEKGEEHKIKDSHYYPRSMEETLRMEELLNQAYEAITDQSDTEFIGALDEMRDIINWSKTRQWNFQWSLIVGVLLFVAFLWYSTGDSKKSIEYNKADLEKIQNGSDSLLYAYRDDMLEANKRNLITYQDYVTDYNSRMDTATLKSNKKEYARLKKEYEEEVVNYQKKVEVLTNANIQQIKEIAIKDKKEYLSRSKGSHRKLVIWTIFFILLVPAYIYAERPYGYMISKRRMESKILEWIRKIMFWLAGSFFAGAAALQVTETVTKWSDGSETRENDGTAIMAMKFVLLLIAAVIFVFTSVALVLYSTIAGLIRNYELIQKINSHDKIAFY